LKRILILILLLSVMLAGCASQSGSEPAKKQVTEQEVRDAVTELVQGINNGDVEVVKKYVGIATPVAEQLAQKLKDNVKLSQIRDVSINGTTAQATVTLEVIPLNVQKDVTLTFDITDVLLLNNPLGLLSVLLK
jgi:PBP1b-binding outer membrane lipoprotein LpoB